MMFCLSAVIFLLKFIESKAEKLSFYYFGLILLVLSSLSKQVFFFISLPVMFLFLDSYCQERKMSYFRFVSSKKFIQIAINTFLIAISLLFIVHPYALLDYKSFIYYQKDLLSGGGAAGSLDETLKGWMLILKPEIVTVSSLALFASIPLLLLMRRNISRLFIGSVFFCGGIIFIIVVGSRASPFYRDLYHLMPLYPFMVLNVAAVILFIFKKLSSFRFSVFSRGFLLILVSYVFIPRAYCNLLYTVNTALRRASYKNTTLYHSYSYIKTNILLDKKIVWTPAVALPDEYDKNACFIWQGCGDYNQMKAFNPDYIVMADQFSYASRADLYKYIEDKRFRKQIAFDSNTTEVCVDSGVPEDKPTYLTDMTPKECFDGLLEQLSIRSNKNIISGPSVAIYED
jgi:hypothetical protein